MTKFTDYWAVNGVGLVQSAEAGLGVATDATTARTISTTDNLDLILFTNGSAITVTLPNNLPALFQCSVSQNGAGQVTVQPGAGAALNTYLGRNHTAGQYAVINIICTSNSNGTSAIYLLEGNTS